MYALIRTRIAHVYRHFLTFYRGLLTAAYSSFGHHKFVGKALDLLPGDAQRQDIAYDGFAAPIVAQSEDAQKEDSPQTRPVRPAGWFALSSRIGLAGALIVSIWWVLPKTAETTPALSEPLPPTASAAATTSSRFAIVNPANVSSAPTVAVRPPAIVAEATPASGQSNGAAARSGPSMVILPTVTPADDGAETVVDVAIPTTTSQEDVAVPTPAAGDSLVANTNIAFIFGSPTPTPTPRVPLVRILPALGLKLSPTPIPPTATPPATPTATATPLRLAAGRLWSNFAPAGPEADHFWIERAFLSGNQLASPNYQFGSTAGNRYRPHHGIDISSPIGRNVRAATTGEVIHAGWDDPALLGPYNSFYGNTVVIRLDRRLPVAGGELDVFLLYGHLSETLVEAGQRVQPDDIVGRVGMTGIAIGPHLHVEVRLGANTYQHSVNPYLWVTPVNGAGAVAVRLLTADGRTWAGARLTLARYENGKAVWARPVETYLDVENIGPDPTWGENGGMGSVPAGYYVIAGSVNGERVRAELVVNAGQTTFVELRTQQ